MKKLLLSLSVIAITGFANAQTFFSENFNNTNGTALPTGWSQNGSGWKTATPATFNSSSFGIPSTTDGRALGVNDDASQTADNSNQIVQTPSIDLTNGTAAALYLKLDLVFPGATYQSITENLKIQASTDNGATWTVLEDVVGPLDMDWHAKYISLASYAGNANVVIGFRYDDGTGWLYGAAIDNMEILNVPSFDLALTAVSPLQGQGDSYGIVGANKTITGSVTNLGATALTSYTVKYQQGANPVQSYTKTVNLAAFSSDNFTHNVPFSIPAVGSFPITVWVELANDANLNNDTLEAFAQGVPVVPVKRLLFEEATGTWCGWCPRGTVAMDDFAANHPGVAAQVAVHNGDPMVVTAYDNLMGTFVDGYPSMVVERTSVIDPGDLEDGYNQLAGSFGYAEFTMGAINISGNSATVPVTIIPAVDITNAKVALVVTESNLMGTGSSWNQVNYYANNAAGPMGGFESQPSSVANTRFHFVARLASPSPSGSTTNVPATMTAGSTYNLNLTANLNASWVQSNLQYVAILLGSDGKALNTAFSATPTLLPIFGPSAVTNTSAGVAHMEAFPNPANDRVNIAIELEKASNLNMVITDLSGKVVYAVTQNLNSGINNVPVETAAFSNGIYMLTAQTENGTTTMKLVVNHN